MPSVFESGRAKLRWPQECGKHAGWLAQGLGHLRIAFLALLALAGVSWTAGCGNGATEPPPPEPSRATTVTVTPGTVQLSALGATAQLSAQVLDQHGQPMAAVAWLSGSATIATVDGSGLVTAVDNGMATITATSASATGRATVTVVQVAARSR